VTFHSFRLRGRADIRKSASDYGGHKTENLCPIYPAIITYGVLLTSGQHPIPIHTYTGCN